MKRIETKLRAYLSHRPKTYAFIVGVGVVLFWRGVWHTADQIHTYALMNTSIDWTATPWWDGPLSLIVGTIILYFTGAFTSSFIGNELILSGLRGERKLNERTEEQVENEVHAISDIRQAMRDMNRNIEQLEKKVLEHHSDKK